jgi:hypothetical protein
MAAVDYAGIREQVATILRALSNVRVYVEADPAAGQMDHGRSIAVFMIGRTAAQDQSASFGKRQRWHVRLTLWTFFYSMESYEAAAAGRDTLLGEMELALMANRTLNGKVEASWFEGGDLFSAKNPQTGAFLAAAETTLVAMASTVNT